jgi:hypothetical protein
MTGNRKIPWLAITGILFAAVLLTSCLNRQRKTIIPEKKFVALLVDLHLAEAIGKNSRDHFMEYVIDSATLYGSVFNKHGVNRVMFDSTMNYYTTRPDKFQKIYNSVTAELKHMEEEAEKAQRALVSEELIWKDTLTYVFPPFDNDRIEIDVPIHGPGTYSVSAKVKMLSDDQAINPRMTVFYYRKDNTPDGKRMYFSEVKYTGKNGLEKEYRATEKLTSPSFSHIKGYIVNYSNVDSFFRRNMVVTGIKVTREVEK